MSVNHESYVNNALSKYKFRSMATPDILRVFRVYPDLKPKLDKFVFNDGNCKDLLNLEGTIPVSYKGAVYNIPIVLWVLDTHPYNPPLVYVKPTSTMRIKPGMHVDSNGKIDIPYIREWQHPRSELVGLLQVLAIVFSESPPVYAVSTPPARPPYPPQATHPPYPQYPMSQSGSSTQIPTPYPQAGGGYMPMPTPSSGPTPGGYQPYPQHPSATPPYPAYPGPQPNFQNPPYPAYPTNSQIPAYPGQNTPSYPNYPYPATQTNTGQGQTSGTSTISDEHLRASLLSAVEDKMRRRLKDTFDQAQAEMDVLYKTQRDLQTGKEKLETMVRDLNKEKGDVEQKIELLTQKDREIKSVLSRMQHQDKVPIDDAVVTVAPLYKQLLNSFAEEQAVEDAIYYLGDALRRDIIDLDVFLKQVRELSRRQFMLRALIQKCREKAGLPGLS